MENNKYLRQTALPQIGEVGQQKLAQASVLVVGVGGLGNALLPYLASSGIGSIGIVDGDIISESNLHRQILFSAEDIGKPKAIIAQSKLKKQFKEITIKSYNEFFTAANALTLVNDYDIIVDATDAIEARYLINDACVLAAKPFVHAAVHRFQFQVATFNVNGSGSYRCLYSTPPKNVQSCAEAGVMPNTVAMAGLFQANEVFKYLLKIGDLLVDKVLLIDTLGNKQYAFNYQKKDISFITEDFFKEVHQTEQIKSVSFNEVKQTDGIFLDVREFGEEPKLNFEGYVQQPLTNLIYNLESLPKAKPIYVFCQTGKRSATAYKILKENDFINVYCLIDNASALA